MEYKVIYASSPSEITKAVNKHIEDGWEIVGSHQVVTRHIQNRFSGMQHKDSIYEIEYSQTIIKRN